MKELKKIIPVFKNITILIMLMSFFNEVRSQQKEDKEFRINIVYKNIYKHFYDSSKKLFKEKTVINDKEKPYAYLWPLCAVLQSANEMDVMTGSKNNVEQTMFVIQKYYNPAKPPAPGYESYLLSEGGDARFYDDNQWIGIACMDVFNRTKNNAYLQRAKTIYSFMLTGYDTVSGGGLYWKEFDNSSKNTCSNAPGVLLALQLYKATKQKKYLDTALILYDWINKHLQSKNGLYYDNVMLPSLQIDKRFFTYNTGTMLESNVLLYSITKEKKYLQTAKKLAANACKYFYKNELFPPNYWFNAVLLRGYEALYKQDKNKYYLNVFNKYADKIWETQRDKNYLIGNEKIKTLLDQAGYLEILVRLYNLSHI